jgi:hypothetical protein
LWPAFVGLFSFHSFGLFNVFPNRPTKAGHSASEGASNYFLKKHQIQKVHLSDIHSIEN